jgi:uridine kinase
MRLASYIVAVCGGSASGKTYLVQRLRQAFTEKEVTLVSMDHYYKDKVHQKLNEAGEINFDHPDALMLDRFEDDMMRLGHGETVSIREYTFNNPNRIPGVVVYKPAPIILVEGLFSYYPAKFSERVNLRVFVESDPHYKFARRLNRDLNERGYPIDETLHSYTNYAIPMYRRHVEPLKFEADLILNNNAHFEGAIRVMTDHLREQLRRV